jgi:cytochrome c-type biogenesis protein CcmH/NrfF
VPNSSLAIPASKNALEEQMRKEMGCVCGGCAHEPLTTCTCGTAQEMRDQLRAQIDLGKTHDQIVEAFVGIYGGQQFLQAPIDKGFNRIAWLFPYLLGATGIVGIGFAAVKWSRHDSTHQPERPPALDAELDERIDDELRDLD